jgi:acetoin utilization protein AcuB
MSQAHPKAQPVRDFMTLLPHTIGPRQTLEDAHRVMRTHGIRHLPVLYGGKLVGVVSQRDLALIESLPDVQPKDVPVEDAMSTDLFVVAPDAPLAGVAAHMADHKLGSAVVVEQDRVIGLFTATDACRALARVLG